MAIYSAGTKYLLDESFDMLLTNFYGSVAAAKLCGPYIDGETRFRYYENSTEALRAIDIAFRSFVEGDANKKSVPG